MKRSVEADDNNVAELITHIRKALESKAANKPQGLDEPSACRISKREDVLLLNGIDSICSCSEDCSAYKAVCVKKRGNREGSNSAVYFESVEQFTEYRNAVMLLGTASFACFEGKLTRSFAALSRVYGVGEATTDAARTAAEDAFGLYFSADTAISDEQLLGSVKLYINRIISTRVSRIFSAAAGKMVSIDSIIESGLEGELGVSAENAPSIDESKLSRSYARRVIIEKIAELTEKSSDSRWNMKDALLPKFTGSPKASRCFVGAYFSRITSREVVWRPMTFAWQVIYVQQFGERFLKNPTFISACRCDKMCYIAAKQRAYVSVIKRQYDTEPFFVMAEGKLAEKNEWQSCIAEFCVNDEQIGKSLSKEIRMPECVYAMAEALSIAMLEQNKQDVIQQ